MWSRDGSASAAPLPLLFLRRRLSLGALRWSPPSHLPASTAPTCICPLPARLLQPPQGIRRELSPVAVPVMAMSPGLLHRCTSCLIPRVSLFSTSLFLFFCLQNCPTFRFIRAFSCSVLVQLIHDHCMLFVIEYCYSVFACCGEINVS